MVDLLHHLAKRDGVMRVAELERLGVRRGAREGALASGHLVRVKKGWVATADADAAVVEAVRAGVVITCVTRARALGLWVLADHRHHVAARPHSGRAPTTTATVHWGRPAVPRHPDSVFDPIENVLVEVARCQPFESALAVWESALNKGLVAKTSLARLTLPPAGRRLLAEADVWSDSGLETFVVPRLRWMRISLRRQIWIHGHHVDLLIGERLVLQIDGGHHIGAQREEDNAHDAALMLLGFHVIRVGYAQVIDRWSEVQEMIMRAIAQGLHLAR